MSCCDEEKGPEEGLTIGDLVEKGIFKVAKDASGRDIERLHAQAHFEGNPAMHQTILEEMGRRGIPHFSLGILDELLIKDIKDYDATSLDTKVLLDDWRIVSAWYSSIEKGRNFKFSKDEVISLAKEIYKELKKRGITFHPQTMKPEARGLYDLIVENTMAEVTSPEEIDDVMLRKVTDQSLLRLHRWVHEWAEKRGDLEPVVNAHIFIVNEFDRRGVEHPTSKEAPSLDKKSRPTVEEYPVAPQGLSKRYTLKEIVDAFPDTLRVEEPFVYLTGGTVNRGFSDMDENGRDSPNDIDILVRNAWTNQRVLSTIMASVPPFIRNNIQFVWSDEEPKVGFCVPLYREVLQKVGREEGSLSEKEVKPFDKIRPLKAASGFEKWEFFDVQSLWKEWASKNIEKGLFIQKKADGMRMLVHHEGERLGIITEDQQRDRVRLFPHAIPEFKKIGKSYIMDTEMVEHNPCSKGRAPKDCDSRPREDMIPFIAKQKAPYPSDERVVFWVHDLLYWDGKSLVNLPYSERFALLQKILPKNESHIALMPNWTAKDKASFESAIQNATHVKGSEGAMLKTADSTYKLLGRTRDWAKIKLVKELDVMIYKKAPVEDQPGVYSYWAAVGPVQDPEKWSPDHIIEHEGRKYLEIGKTYNTPHNVPIGGIMEVDTIRIREYKDSKGMPYLTWMFPVVRRPRPDKKSPDPIATAIRISKAGAGPLSLSEYEVRLEPCPFYSSAETCPLYLLYERPYEEEELSLLIQHLKFPIACPKANLFRCRYVKSYYYEFKEVESNGGSGPDNPEGT